MAGKLTSEVGSTLAPLTKGSHNDAKHRYSNSLYDVSSMAPA